MLEERSGSVCELCAADQSLSTFIVAQELGQRNPPAHTDNVALLCALCQEQIEARGSLDPTHWRCLNESMWSEYPVIQVLAWRLLQRLGTETWAQDLIEMLYLEEDVQTWAAMGHSNDADAQVQHVDAHGAELSAGDTVVLIKDLQVKGAGFTAKRGTTVRNITVVTDNVQQIEGRVNGQQIVILTQYVKKSN